MDFFSQHIIPSSAEHLKLLEFLAVVTYSIHLPYVALVLGAAMVSMWLTFSDSEIPDARFARLSEDLVETFLGGKLTMLVLGVMPVLVLPFIYMQWFVGKATVPIQYMLMAVPGIVIGFAMLALYRSSFAARRTNLKTHLGFGLMGVGLLKVSYFVMIATAARFHDPEKWFRLKNLAILLLNWNVIYKFLLFLHLALAVTGAGILFFLFRWSQRGFGGDEAYVTFARKFGAGLGLAFCFAVPVFNILYVFTSPDVIFDSTTYGLAAAITAVCMVIAYAFIGALQSSRPRYGATTFILFLVVFVLSSAFDLRAMANANREHARLLGQAHEKKVMEREAELEVRMAELSGKNLGEETFKRVCTQCHSFDTKLVGPALMTVLPKYRGNVEGLKAFILNPTKVDPAFPPMPNPGLTPAQAEAVARYELGHLETAAGGETAPAAEPAATEVQSGQTNH